MIIELSRVSRILAGILLLSLVTVETGGLYMVRLVGYGADATDFQLGFARAGHAHAGVLLILSLVGLVYADAARLTGISGILGRFCVPVAALLMPAGFFFSSIREGATAPNGLIVLVWIGGLSLAVGLITLGIGMLRSGLRRGAGTPAHPGTPAGTP
ncbi:MAG TPA: hypothetical protein VFZ32_21990 [Micromonosporaceae bacterium]